MRRSWGSANGVVDVGVVVIAHFENPAKGYALSFLRDVLSQRNKAIIPLTTLVGAYHIQTRYLRVPKVEAKSNLQTTLRTCSPSFYTDISVEDVEEALEYAAGYSVESWDGYIGSLAKRFADSVVYTIDEKLRRIPGITALNPIPGEAYRKYLRWLRGKLKRRT